MENNNSILIELKEISPFLAGIEKRNVFTVPEGYFEGLSAVLLQGIKGDDSVLLSDLSKRSLQEVPAGYFDHLADSILDRVKAKGEETAAEELKALSPMLYSIQNENVFDVPEAYFSDLPDTVLHKLDSSRTPVLALRRKSSLFIRYAVAAAFTGMMALGVFKFTGNNAVLPEYVTDGLKPHNVDEELAKFDNEDIIKYLQSNNESVDVQTLAVKTLDENELPTQADYLSDEKALDNYLDNINVNDLNN